MKGQASYMFGILIVLLGMVIFVANTTFRTGDQINIASGSVEVWSSIHAAEKLKRAVEAAATVDVELAVKELAPIGGGFKVWKPGQPNETQLTELLESRMRAQLRKFDVEGLEGRLISWGPPVVSISDASDSGFSYSGQRPFSIDSKLANPEVQLQGQGAFEGTMETAYLKLLRVGRALASGCPNVTVGARTVEGLEMQVANATVTSYAVNITAPAEPITLNFILEC